MSTENGDKNQIETNKEEIAYLRQKTAHHIETANAEMGAVKEDIGEIKTDLKWLKKNHWMVSTGVTGALIAGVLNLIK